MLPLILFILLGIFILVAFELRARKNKEMDENIETNEPSSDGECCGRHLVCERESLLVSNAQIEYYDDEELDAMAGLQPAELSEEQSNEIRAIFRSLQEKDVAGWARSMQMRNIPIPEDVREEALLIVRERRAKN